MEQEHRENSQPEVAEVSAYFGPRSFEWLIPGVLGGCARPGLSRDIGLDLDALHRVRATILVTLTEEWNAPEDEVRAAGITPMRFAIPDMGAPSPGLAAGLCKRIEAELRSGAVAVYHCRAGRGRTGTMLAAHHIWRGMSADAAIRETRSRNAAWIESPVQLNFLRVFADYLGSPIG